MQNSLGMSWSWLHHTQTVLYCEMMLQATDLQAFGDLESCMLRMGVQHFCANMFILGFL